MQHDTRLGSSVGVVVRDLEPVLDLYTEGLALVEEWLGGQAEFVRTGPPRFFGYNGPFTPWFMRYGEVQVPVERVETR